ncbi:hypothetical protein ONZ45_g13712 [Pleurotus djamor]|nr:hypothetical protein ONZ45_g13712 [Pleurotus djamor]
MNYVGILAEESGALRRAYVDMFRDHLASVEAHLRGKESEPLLPSFVPPAGYWTSVEKEAFFHALSIHSRLRPDLIAQSIGTKTVLDVCAYIDILDSAAAELGGQEGIRAQMDPAMHVSRYWQMWENTQATALIAAETRWQDMALAAEHDTELAAKEATVPVEISEDEFLAWKAEKEQQWASEAVLDKLDAFKLKLLDALHADEQCETMDIDDSRGLSLEPRTSIRHIFDDEYATENTSHANDPLDDNDNGADELGGLSPRSKRRVLKRMYMRRKRAELKGTDPLATSEKLKPGRQPKKRPPRPRPKKYNTKRRRLGHRDVTDSSSSEDDDGDVSNVEGQNEADERHDAAADGDEGDPNDHIRHPHASGSNQQQKARDALQSHGLMNDDTLRQYDLDLFGFAP